ncbi:carboxylesterase 1E-like [Mizuhopecten yessoensis]|uniref:Carboxylic ester hydrolase n=1 Tax=Mizuhopecten yessoensis TaxID=6573 RepID=A0A210PTB1_MIZYE|nr:carboxylesterase 1E-like [Mizuhopecten yessoensis]OWF39737.1 Liver carboxylesterase 1 [Mizuhopecten yessoensis]
MILPVLLFLLPILPLAMFQAQPVQYHTLGTPLGKLTGRQIAFGTDATVYQFLKIPFAKPPVGDLRFQKTVPVERWSSIHDSTEHGPSCLQEIPAAIKQFLSNKEVSEDCLHLNVYTSGDLSPTTNKSVMVFFHGGGFLTGQAQLYDGSGLAVNGDVIVVTVNYRLGVLGFFSTGDSVARGNYGLWDQIEALKWVQNNIGSFGGNPNSVTIFGESAGAFSVSLLSVIPENKGLFQRVILQSGDYSSYYAINKKPNDFATAFSYQSKCRNLQTSQAMFDCVRNIPADRIIPTQNKAILFSLLAPDSLFNSPLAPVIDGDLIKSDPVESAQNTSSDMIAFFQSLDLMAGCVSTEGSLLQAYIYPYMETKYDFNTSEGVPTSLLRSYFARTLAEQLYNNQSNVWRAIVDKFGSSDIEVQARKIMDLYGDVFFYLPMIRAVDLHSSNNKDGNTFQYMFSEPTPIPISGKQQPSWFRGSEHGADLIFLFGIEKLNRIISIPSSTMDFVQQLRTYWTNFANNGDPNRGRNVNIRWPEYNSANRSFIDLAASSVSQQTAMLQDRVKFWEKDLPLIASTNVTDSAVSLATAKWTILIMLFVNSILRRL